MRVTRDASGLPPEIEQAAALWPFNFSSLTTPALAVQLVAYLPYYDCALSLIEAYSSGFLWLCTAIDRTEVLEDLLPLFYSPPSQMPVLSTETEAKAIRHAHELVVLFALFAAGATVDAELGSENLEARLYSNLARAALSMRSILEEGSISACRAVFLLGSFEGNARKWPVESTWRLYSIGLSLASSVRPLRILPLSLLIPPISIGWIEYGR